jgi:CheY-like chemotaxis protein/anti-sigma regulatory factor (Ser/Thr protein kinase)
MSKILVVEDSKAVLSNIVKILNLNGYNTLSATNGAEGFEIARTELPDLIISDIMMPECDGYTLLNDLRKNSKTEQIPIIFLSAKVDRIEIRKGMVAGADDYITKPFRTNDLIESIETQLAKKTKLNSKLEELYSNISTYIPHELRTPLVSIFGYTDMMISDLDLLSKGEMKIMLSGIRNTADRLYKTLEKFLRYSETELMMKDQASYKELLDNYVSSPHWMIEEVLEKSSFRSRVNYKNDVKATEFEIKIFADHFKLIVEELLVNANKFSTKDSEILLETKNSDNKFSVTVTNYGRGMSSEEIAKISPFVQHKRKVYEQDGNGLGLAIIKRLCEFYSAQIQINSHPDSVTRIEVLFSSRLSVPEGIAI